MAFEDEVFLNEDDSSLTSEIDYIIEEVEEAETDLCCGDVEDEGDIIDLIADDTTEIGEDENSDDYNLLGCDGDICDDINCDMDPEEDDISINDGLYEESVDGFTADIVINSLLEDEGEEV